jgi:hypothetical protein
MSQHLDSLRVEAPRTEVEQEGSSMIGMSVRVRDHHTMAERRGMVGEVVGYSGGDDYVAVEVLLADGECQLFWAGDLDEISSPSVSPWWRP